jgi:hypothetical protein
MTNKDHQTQDQPTPRNDDGALQLILSMADTTWRMFVPPAIVVPAGIYGDLQLGTKPWLTIVAAAAGLAVSVLLVKRQLRQGQ